MAKKAELLETAKNLNLAVSRKNTIAEIEAAIKSTVKVAPKPAGVTEVPDLGNIAEADNSAAKAGKRSQKGRKASEEKKAKIDAQKHREESAQPEEIAAPRRQQKVRTKLERSGKKMREAAKLIDKDKVYKLHDALELAAKSSYVKFDATAEIHIRLNVDPRQADQNIRNTIVLPAGTGKSSRVAVYADGEDVAKAKKAGADIAAADELLQDIEKGDIKFDVLIATPKVMAKLGKYARILGPKGLMPNPKSGTVTTDVAKAVAEAKAGRVEYRVDSTGIIHTRIGKVSFGQSKLVENARVLLSSVKSGRPSGIKGNFVKSIYVTTTMGPSVNVDVSEMQ